MDTTQTIAIIGAGISGIQAALGLNSLGYKVILIEKKPDIGGHVRLWKKTFPYLTDAQEILNLYSEKIKNSTVSVLTDTEIIYTNFQNNVFALTTDKNQHLSVDVILLTTGFDTFDVHKKEEYGYGIYKGVMTNVELESVFHNPDAFVNSKPERIGFIHCVGSRDAKAGNTYCSKVCCATAVKQAIEVKELLPETEVFCFYMDLRMFGKNYEELFRIAQEKYSVHFIRARLSEVNQTINGKLSIRVEDTLTSKPLKMTLDYIVLMSGIIPSYASGRIQELLKLKKDDEGFFKIPDEMLSSNSTDICGVFVAGNATGPKTIPEAMNDASSAVLSIHEYLSQKRN